MFKSLTLASAAVLFAFGTAHAADAPKAVSATSTTTVTTETAKSGAPAIKPDGVPGGRHAGGMMGRGNGACAPVFDACKNAGFKGGMHKDGKGLIADCVRPLEDGKSVAGVTVDKTAIDACKADYAARKAEFDAKVKADPDFAAKVAARKAKWAARNPDATKAMDSAAPAAPAVR